MRSVLFGQNSVPLNFFDVDDHEEPPHSRPVLDIELSGGLDEFVRVPRNLNEKAPMAEQDIFSTFGYDDK